jgi:5'-nucleotidase (lipoprotein e(P4) family)
MKYIKLYRESYESDSWYQWSAMEKLILFRAVLIFKICFFKGIEILVLLTWEKERDFTIKNLQKFNFPTADSAHLFPLQNTSSKEVRRQNIASNHTIVMLMGDNLGDFSSLFDKKSIEERNQNVSSAASEFGNRFIVLPNPVYGDWESSLYNYDYSLTEVQKDSVIKASLHSY